MRTVKDAFDQEENREFVRSRVYRESLRESHVVDHEGGGDGEGPSGAMAAATA